MLLSLHLHDFVIVDRADIDFGEGFTVLTGETGAGKSILLDALGLILGARAETGVVREGCKRADLAASFASTPMLESWLSARALSGDPGTVLLRRVIEADGRSRALVNGQPTTVTVLREIGQMLVDVHGQHAAQLLTRPDAQRQMLDEHAGLATDIEALGRAHATWQSHQTALDQARAGDREARLELERLQWQAGELEALKLDRDEWETLNAEQRRLAHASSLVESSRAAAEAISGSDESVIDRLRSLHNRLRPLIQIDPRLGASAELIETATIQLDEAASSLDHYADRLDIDPDRLTQIDQRISAIFNASRKFRLSPESIPDELDRIRQRLHALEASQDIAHLEAQALASRTTFDEIAARVSKLRKSNAERFAEGVSDTLAELGMVGARLIVAVEPAAPSARGVDAIEFRISQHGSSTARPIAKIASGGELSRIGLAIAVLAAQANPVPTLIFDEADAGVGGAVAEVIGTLMRGLGAERQVLCVTHLPQVAAHAHQHFKVSLDRQSGQGSLSRVDRLDQAERVEEVARMLGGVAITATTRRHAREMLGPHAK
jgi:DNA repair protein RecN (Recombination protein N)